MGFAAVGGLYIAIVIMGFTGRHHDPFTVVITATLLIGAVALGWYLLSRPI